MHVRGAIIVALSRKALSTEENVRRASERGSGFERSGERKPFLLSRITVEMRARAVREPTEYVTSHDKAAGAARNTSSRYFSRYLRVVHVGDRTRAGLPLLYFIRLYLRPHFSSGAYSGS